VCGETPALEQTGQPPEPGVPRETCVRGKAARDEFARAAFFRVRSIFFAVHLADRLLDQLTCDTFFAQLRAEPEHTAGANRDPASNPRPRELKIVEITGAGKVGDHTRRGLGRHAGAPKAFSDFSGTTRTRGKQTHGEVAGTAVGVVALERGEERFFERGPNFEAEARDLFGVDSEATPIVEYDEPELGLGGWTMA
jgi:hypothetical protein